MADIASSVTFSDGNVSAVSRPLFIRSAGTPQRLRLVLGSTLRLPHTFSIK